MRYSVQDDMFIYTDGEDLLSDMVDFMYHMQSRVNTEGKTFEILETFYNTMVMILGRADFEPVIPNGTVVDLVIPTDPSLTYIVKKFDKVNHNYFITCKPKSFNGKTFGFWIQSDFVNPKTSSNNERKNSNV